MDVTPVTLDGDYVRLEPLSLDDHLDGLQEAGAHPGLFRWFPKDRSSPDAMRAFVEEALAAQRAGTALPFATVLQETDEVIGSTRFGNVAPEHRRVEIGWTWITPSHQRTPANTEAKYHMLAHAFEQWECVRVELKTDARNRQSIDAIRRIGATEEGTLRKHMQTHQGPRDTVYFSVLDDEWPAVKRDLEAKLSQEYTE
ncbi:MAG: GNAT family N-acetyltransferase [Haloarculaceae archaeon]